MKKLRLVESFPTQDELLDSIGDDVKDKILNDIDTGSFNESSWDSAKSQCDSVQEVNNLIMLFISIHCGSWGLTVEKIDPWKDVLIHIIDEMGFSETSNPFIAYLTQMFYYYNYNFNFTRDEVVLINNLWSDGTLDSSDIRGVGERGRNQHIIFNVNLWTDNTSMKDKSFLIKAYQTLSNPSTVSNLNLSAIARSRMFDSTRPYLKKFKDKYDEDTGEILSTSGLTTDMIRNIIMFVDENNPLGAINNVQYINKALTMGQENVYLASRAEDTARVGRVKNSPQQIAQQMSELSLDDRLEVIKLLNKNKLLNTNNNVQNQ